jgi:hypothetical protein
MSAYDKKLKEGAKPFLDDGEEVIASLVARPRGHTQSIAGSSMIGNKQKNNAREAAAAGGLELASPMALAVTPKRLVVFKIGSPIGLGIGGKVKELVSSVPLADVDSIDVKRLAAGQVVTVTVKGNEVKLEANAMAGGKGLAEAFDQAKASA